MANFEDEIFVRGRECNIPNFLKGSKVILTWAIGEIIKRSRILSVISKN